MIRIITAAVAALLAVTLTAAPAVDQPKPAEVTWLGVPVDAAPDEVTWLDVPVGVTP